MKNEMRKLDETQLGRYKGLLDLVGERKGQLLEFLVEVQRLMEFLAV